MAETEQINRYLPIQPVCELLQPGERTVYEMCRQAKLPDAVNVSGSWRLDETALRDWLARGGEAGRPGEDA